LVELEEKETNQMRRGFSDRINEAGRKEENRTKSTE
jgi:hypothetical protein